MQIPDSSVYSVGTVKMTCNTCIVCVCLYVYISLRTQYVTNIRAYQFASLLKPNILILVD